MTRINRRRLLIAVPLAAVVLAMGFAFHALSDNLMERWARVEPGMTRGQVEAILGRPAVILPKGPTGTGEALIWVDMLWQVDVTLGPDGRVLRTGCVPSDSFYRRTVRRIF